MFFIDTTPLNRSAHGHRVRLLGSLRLAGLSATLTPDAEIGPGQPANGTVARTIGEPSAGETHLATIDNATTDHGAYAIAVLFHTACVDVQEQAHVFFRQHHAKFLIVLVV